MRHQRISYSSELFQRDGSRAQGTVATCEARGDLLQFAGRWWLLLVAICLTAISLSQAKGQVFSDDFNDNTFGSLWTPMEQPGAIVVETTGRVEMTLTTASANAGLELLCAVRGDFDVQVDYSLLTWPVAGGGGINLYAFSPAGGVGITRANTYGYETYMLTLLNPGAQFIVVPTTDLSGTLRLTRTGLTGTAYHFTGGAWIPVDSGQISSADTNIYVLATAAEDPNFLGPLVRISVDNFVLSKGELVCPQGLCGNAVVDPGEQCDDGNSVSGDGCCACQREPLVNADVNGNWQMNGNCAGAIGASSMVLTGNATSGSVSWATTDCGTIFLDGAIHKFSSCTTTPSPVQGQVCGTILSVPAGGLFTSQSKLETPYPSGLGTCNDPPLARATALQRFDGSIATDASGKATRITGTSTNDFTLLNTDKQTCASFDNIMCSFVMLRNDVSQGDNQTVEPLEGGTVTFSSVTTTGITSITPLGAPDGEVPANFQLLETPIFYDVTTTATISGPIVVCLPYPDADNDGVVDGTSPPINESDLKVLHNEGGVFTDRTLNRDTVKNRICAQVSSLSQFVFGAGEAPTTNVDAIAVKCPCAGPPTGGPWQTHAKYTSCVSKTGKALQRGGFVTATERKSANAAASQSTCGSVGKTRCCATIGATIKCKIKTAAQCAKKGGTDEGVGSCIPSPCAGG